MPLRSDIVTAPPWLRMQTGQAWRIPLPLPVTTVLTDYRCAKWLVELDAPVPADQPDHCYLLRLISTFWDRPEFTHELSITRVRPGVRRQRLWEQPAAELIEARALASVGWRDASDRDARLRVRNLVARLVSGRLDPRLLHLPSTWDELLEDLAACESA